MPVLHNPRHERFAQELAKGKTADAAYEEVGFKKNRHNASRLAREEHIRTRVAELLAERDEMARNATQKATEALAIDRQWVLGRLVENVQRAMQAAPVKLSEDGEPINGEWRYEGSVANRALELLGKELGMFIDRKEVGRPGEFDGMNADDIRAAIKRRLGLAEGGDGRASGGGSPRVTH
jgi:phage terminase small subunit